MNDAGEIAGFYPNAATGLQRGFIATPALANPAPEPRTLSLLLGALLLVAGRFRMSRVK